MTRHLLWVALGVALGASALGYQNLVAAQDSAGTSAEETADTSQSDSGAQAGQEQSGTSSTGQTESGAQPPNSSDSNQAGNQSSGGTTSDAPLATGDGAANPTNTPNVDSAEKTNTNNQSSQGSPTAPLNSNDPNAVTSPQQRRIGDNQQSIQQDPNANRNQGDVAVEDRARLNGSTQQSNEATFQRGLQFGPATNRGLSIREVDQNSLYFRSGFRRGDMIISLYGRPVRNQADFMRFIVLQPGRPVPVVIFRNGRQQTIYVEYPQEVVQTHHIYGNRAPQGGAYLGVMFDVQVRNAAVVLSVNPGSPAEKARIQPQDVILAMNGQEIRSYPEVISMIRSMRPGQEVDIIVGRGQSETQLFAVLDASANMRTATRGAEVNVYQPADVQVDVNRRNNNGRIIDRDRNNDGNSERPLLPRLRN